MVSYWLRHRLPYAVIFAIAAVLVVGLVFVRPYIDSQAQEYNAQSVYKNTKIDFIVPEPSFEQIHELAGNYGIDKIFPYYATKANVTVNDKTRPTFVLLSDQFENIDTTMYSESRLIQKSETIYDNPILADWQFCHDISASIGDVVNVTLGDIKKEFTVCAIYETNEIYDSGAILAQISTTERDAIAQNSNSNGYSGAYITASDYSECRSYLTTEYRPLGRLKERERFDNEEAYNIHYHAIMDTGYSNEITDLRVRENSLDTSRNDLSLYLGALIVLVLYFAFNMAMSRRGSEKMYFEKHCIPAGIKATSYYIYSFVGEIVLFTVLFIALVMMFVNLTQQYIPGGVVGLKFAIIPVAGIIAETLGICLSVSQLRN
jgi:hypothetical protein